MRACFRIAAQATFALGAMFSSAAAGEASPPNAALSYWPGSQFLPRYVQLDEGERKAFSDPVSAPLDEAAGRLVEKSGLALAYVHRGARIPGCDWGVDPSAGPMMLIPHMDYVRPIQRVMLLRARTRIAAGRDAEAVGDLADSMVLARHLAADGTPVGHMVRCALEAQAIEVVAANLGELDAGAAGELRRRIDRLPEVESGARRIERERAMFIGWARLGLEEGGPEGLRRRLGELIRGNIGSTDAVKARELEGLLGAAVAKGRGHLDSLLGQTESDYAAFVAVMNAPAEGLEAAVAEFRRTVEGGNVVTQILMGSVINPRTLREVELKAEARLAILKAALAVAQDGPAAADEVGDPFGTGPLKYAAAEDGFTLTSALPLGGEPFALTFRTKPAK